MSEVLVSEDDTNWILDFGNYFLKVPKTHYGSSEGALQDLLFEDVDSDKVKNYITITKKNEE